ncbi:MAG: diacylglycerol kinase family protein [Bacillota bacterium]
MVTFFKSLSFAVSGIRWVVAGQRNMKFHILAALLVLAAAVLFRISPLEMALVLVAIAMVMVAEVINTAIESTVDLITTERHPLAGRAKDAAAGAVLLAVIFSAAIGFIVFMPRIWRILLQ